MKDYYQLLNTWEDFPNFLQWIVECCGVEEDSELYNTLKLHVASQAELDDWINHFEGNIDEIEAVTQSYLTSKFKVA